MYSKIPKKIYYFIYFSSQINLTIFYYNAFNYSLMNNLTFFK